MDLYLWRFGRKREFLRLDSLKLSLPAFTLNSRDYRMILTRTHELISELKKENLGCS